MNKPFFSLLLTMFAVGIGILPHTAAAQEPDNRPCVKAFERAQADYQNGRVFKVLELENCLSDLPAYLKGSAYYLLFKSYVLVSNDSMANYSMARLLQENPEIDPKVEDEKFRYFYQQFEPRVSEIGLFVGQNLHAPAIEAGEFARGLTIGLTHQQEIRPKLFFFQNLIYSERSQWFDGPTGDQGIPGTLIGQEYIDPEIADFYGIDNPQDYPTYTYHLAGLSFPTFLEAATGLNWVFFANNRIETYLSGGLAANYLIEKEFDEGYIYYTYTAYAYNTTNPNATEPIIFQEVEEPEEYGFAGEVEHQTKFNFHLLGGAGVRYQLGKGVLFFDARYQRSLLPQKVRFTDTDGSFEQTLSIYQSNDFKFQTQTLTFSVGYSLKILRFKNMRK